MKRAGWQAGKLSLDMPTSVSEHLNPSLSSARHSGFLLTHTPEGSPSAAH